MRNCSSKSFGKKFEELFNESPQYLAEHAADVFLKKLEVVDKNLNFINDRIVKFNKS